MTPDIDLDAIAARADEVLADPAEKFSLTSCYLAKDVHALLSALTAARAELEQRRQYEARIWQRIQAWNDDPTTRLEAFAITWERVETAEQERDAARAEADKLRAEVAHLTRERDEVLLWVSPKTKQVFAQQWAEKRAAGAGDGEQDTATTGRTYRDMPVVKCHLVRRDVSHMAHVFDDGTSKVVCNGLLPHSVPLDAPASVQGAADGEAQA